MKVPKKVIRWLIYSFTLLFIFILHISYLNNGFVWLDHGDIEQGRAIVSVDKLPDAFLTRFGDSGFYRPLVTILHSLDMHTYAQWAQGYHFTNLLLHMAVVIVTPFFLAVFFPLSFFEMILVMLIAGAHPVGWLPVGAISYRSEMLLAFFLFATVYFHAKARLKQHPIYGFLTVICLALALFSKETAFVLVPALIILWECTAALKKKHFFTYAIPLYISEGIVLLLYAILRFNAVPELWRIANITLSLSDSIGTRVSVLFQLVFDLASPFKPPLSDAVKIVGLGNPLVLLTLICIAVIGWMMKKKIISSQWRRGILLFAVLLTPALNIVPVPRWGSPHYGYIVLSAFALLCVFFFRWIRQKQFGIQIIMLLLGAVWLGIAAYNTFFAGFRFSDDISLFTPEVRADPHFLEGYFYLGSVYLFKNDRPHAEEAFKHALQTDKTVIAYQEPYAIAVNYALVKVKQKKLKDADALLAKAQANASEEQIGFILYNRAVLAMQQKDYKKVISLLKNKKGLLDRNAYLLLADALHKTGNDKEASRVLEESKNLFENAKPADFLKEKE